MLFLQALFSILSQFRMPVRLWDRVPASSGYPGLDVATILPLSCDCQPDPEVIAAANWVVLGLAIWSLVSQPLFLQRECVELLVGGVVDPSQSLLVSVSF